MVRGTTPTFILSFGENSDVDLASAQNIYFTIEQKGTEITKTGDDIVLSEGNTVSVFLNQRESFQLSEGAADIQLNWTYRDSNDALRRAATKAKTIQISKQLLGRVVE